MAEILVVEDDEYKASDIQKLIEVRFGFKLDRAASVTTALRAIVSRSYALVVLDMSLPTFDIAGPGGGGSPQGQGGIEVLRLAGRLQNSSKFVVVTQYPDIEISGFDIALSRAAPLLASQFKVSVERCILYEFDNGSWQLPLIEVLEKIVVA